MKGRKLILTVLSVACIGAMAFGIAGCGVISGQLNSESNASESNSEDSSLDTPNMNEENIATEGLVFKIVKEQAMISDYIGTATEVVIPQTHNGLPVTGIISSAFESCDWLTKIVIPDSVISIGDSAFSCCSSLKEIVIPDSVTDIQDSIFEGCDNLQYNEKNKLKYLGNENNPWFYLAEATPYIKTATIENSCKFIGDFAFWCCSGLTEIEIPNSVISIGSGAFSSCENLKKVVIPNSVISIGEGVFKSCDSLQYNEKGELKYLGNENNEYHYLADTNKTDITSAEIESSCKIIGFQAFLECRSLTEIVIPDNVIRIEKDAFRDCKGLTRVFADEKTWYNISFGDQLANPLFYAQKLYFNNDLVTELVIPQSITEIKNYTFYNCDSLKSVSIHDNVKSIGHSAFNSCSSLTDVTLGKGIRIIDSWAFLTCNNLTRVFADIETWCNISFGVDWASPLYNGANLYLDNELATNIIIPESITEIKPFAFSYYNTLKEIVIPDSVEIIGKYAFYNCSSLTFYCEAESQPSGWDKDWNSSNCPVYWYSETQPTTTGNYWHHDENGEIVVW